MKREASPAGRARIVAVGTTTTEVCYSQEELLDLFQIRDRRVRSIFLNSHIARRYLILPPDSPDGTKRIETQGELLQKHRTVGVDLGVRAVRACLEQANASIDDLRYICCVSTTGLLTPGFSALLCHEMNLPHDCGRLDVVGMGCNAGLNGLNAVANWAEANSDELAVMVCIEVCSAAYVFDGTMRSIVVNSLFGDGAAAIGLRARADGAGGGAAILRFASCLIPDTLEAMRYDWDDVHGKFSFFIDRQVPYVVGAHSEQIVDRLLSNFDLRRKDIVHWVVHGGGKKVIDAIMVNLGLTRHDMRHTLTVLRDYGNLSSGSFLFSYKRLLDEGAVKAGDYGVLITMGPGSTIETALVQW
jgi:alkylresorcinol/alkylpyrone synthase/polyketide synthase Type III